MKIALLTLAGPEFRGGVEKFNSMLIDCLSEKHEVDLHPFLSLELSSSERFLAKASEKTPYSGYVKARILAKHFKKREDEYDFVIANDFFGLYVEKPVLQVFHGYYADVFDCMRDRISFPYWLWGQELARVQRSALAKAKLVVTPSQRNFDYLSSRKIPVHKVIPHGIDTDFYRPVRDPYPLLENYNLPKRFILTVGSRAPWKNEKIIEQASHDYSVVSVSANRKGNLIKYLSGVEEEKMPRLYSASSMLLHPSLHEGFGYVVAEAMSCGAPAVFSKTGFGPEMARELPELIVENPRDYAQVKGAIENCLANRPEFSRRSRKFITEHNSLSDWKKKWLALVEEFL